LLVAAILIERNFNLATWQLLLIYLVPYLIVGYETLHEAFENITEGEVFDENFLMAIATLGAMGIGFLPGAENQFPEAVFVMLFFQIGELFEGIAEGKSRKSISDLLNIRPDTAHLIRNGEEVTVNPTEVNVGETIVIKPGERVPMDGIVLEGNSSLDTVALTGESVPRSIQAEDEVISGCVNLSGLLKVKVTKSFGESTASKVIELVENAGKNKSTSEAFITRFARIYTPIVVGLALLLAFIPPFFGENGYFANLSTWLYRALTFLVVSCPCALVISVPLAFFGGIGGASKRGVLVKGSNYIEALSKLKTVVFDKTGTLTHGVFSVTAIHPTEISESELLHLAAHVERHSNHPIAISLKDAYPNEADECVVEQTEEIAGHGVRALVNGKVVCVGNSKMMESVGAKWEVCEIQSQGSIVHVAIEGKYMGHIIISDVVKEDAKEAISALKKMGVKKSVMLTGDHKEVGEFVAKEVGVDECHAELLPTDKVTELEALLKEKSEEETLAFVGDGLNDAPVLARADVGIAMGGLGSDAAIEAADVVLMDDKPSKIAEAIRIAKKTMGIAKQNVVFSIGVKVAVLLLAAFGIANMGLAIFADVGVTILAVLNAMRTLKA
ncbi:MAG: cadmium-translocating P-type ATPase, partial [Paludibacteraceae bacterium]|nr:cadmium-translocating P-type ATPase [Paludibacteraceae bacterium]